MKIMLLCSLFLLGTGANIQAQDGVAFIYRTWPAPFPVEQKSLYSPQVNSNVSTKAQAAVQRLFGHDIEPAADRKPYYLTGDFNGDTREDLLVLVRLQGATTSLPKEVRVLNPWGYESKNSPGPSPLALAIVHGASEGWDAQTPLGRFLLADREFFSTPIWEATSQGAPLSLKKKPATRSRRREALPKMAKGDAVGLGTEAGIDIVLYWDGKTYRLYEPQEEP